MLAIHLERDPPLGSPSHLAERIKRHEIPQENVNAKPFSARRDIMQEVAERIGAAVVRAIGRQFHAAVDIRGEDKTPCAACA